MDLPTYTNIWRIEKRLYKLYDFRLPAPLPITWIAVFAGITVPYIFFLVVIGLPFNHNLVWLYVLPPGVLTWLTTRPVIESKRLPELVSSQLRYLSEPQTWCRMAPLAEKDDDLPDRRACGTGIRRAPGPGKRGRPPAAARSGRAPAPWTAAAGGAFYRPPNRHPQPRGASRDARSWRRPRRAGPRCRSRQPRRNLTRPLPSLVTVPAGLAAACGPAASASWTTPLSVPQRATAQPEARRVRARREAAAPGRSRTSGRGHRPTNRGPPWRSGPRGPSRRPSGGRTPGRWRSRTTPNQTPATSATPASRPLPRRRGRRPVRARFPRSAAFPEVGPFPEVGAVPRGRRLPEERGRPSRGGARPALEAAGRASARPRDRPGPRDRPSPRPGPTAREPVVVSSSRPFLTRSPRRARPGWVPAPAPPAAPDARSRVR